MHERPHPHLDQTRTVWKGLERYRRAGKLTVDGQSLDIAGVVAVSRFVPTYPPSSPHDMNMNSREMQAWV